MAKAKTPNVTAAHTGVLNLEVIGALRGLMNYTGGWDEKPGHPCAIGAKVLAKTEAVKPAIDSNAVLRELIESHGLSFGDCVAVFAEQRDAYDIAAVTAALADGDDNDLAVDSNAICSRDDDGLGCFVMAWHWVHAEHILNLMEPAAAAKQKKGGPAP